MSSMRFGYVTVAGLLFLALMAALAAPVPAHSDEPSEPGLFADLKTSRGTIRIRLHFRQAPLTVMNFVGLAEGTQAWTDPQSGEPRSDPLYKGIRFHVVRDFIIQTGDPTGTGTGGPGYAFGDEVHPGLRHDRAGVVAMANRGPNTNGSQFYITRKPAPWLDGHHNVFAEVVSGLDVVQAIEKGDTLEEVTVYRVGADALGFDAAQAHRYAEINREAERERHRKVLAQTPGPLDPAKVPDPGQESVSPGDFRFLVIGHTEMRNPGLDSGVFWFNREQALAFAGELVRVARSEGVEFEPLIEQYSDVKRNSRSRDVKDGPRMPVGLKAIFRLRPGQISDPVDLPGGVYIFERLR